MDRYIHTYIHTWCRQVDGRTDRCIHRDVHGWMDGWMDRWMPIRTERLKKRKRKLCDFSRFLKDGRCMAES